MEIKVGLPTEVDAFERAFQKIQNEYVRSVGAGKNKADYNDRMKVVLSFTMHEIKTWSWLSTLICLIAFISKELEAESEQLGEEVYELLKNLNSD